MDNIIVYHCRDNRLRAYNKKTKKVTSYPRVLLEQKLGRELLPNEQVHHIDRNPLNNEASNLEIQLLGEHQRSHAQKYYDKEMVCPNCGQIFIWPAKAQRQHYVNQNRHRYKNPICRPFCSRKCSGQYTRALQLNSQS